MSKELVVSSNRHETRVALLEDDQLVEIYYQREQEYSLAGSIHKGRVTRVLPGMQSAFVDIGLDRDAFLYVSDFFEDNEDYETVVSEAETKALRSGKTAEAPLPVEPVSLPREREAEPDKEAVVEVAAEPAPPAQDRGDRDRKGRRSRRRRGRGRGFPDSKYATPGEAPGGEDEVSEPAVGEADVEAEVEAAAPVEEDFSVLPGETLRKYRRPSVEPEDLSAAPAADDDTDEGEAEPERDRADEVAEVVLAAVEKAEAELKAQTDSKAQAAGAESKIAVDRAVETTVEPSDSVQPEEPVVREAAAGSEAPAVALVDAEVVVQALPVEADEEGPSAEVSVEESGDTTEPDEPVAESDAGPEDEAEIEADAEQPVSDEAAEEGSEEIAAEAAEGTAEPEGDGSEVEPARRPTSLTATLREQGLRYPHRVSRRMRRKMRAGEGRVDGRPDSKPEVRVEETKPAEPAAPEQRQERSAKVERPQPSIADLLKEGQEIIVQIAKEPIGQKGARITSYVALPGRYVVYMPTVDHVGVSRKIGSDEERDRLKKILQANRVGMPGGFILRTAGEGKTEEALRTDMQFLHNLWMDIRQKAEKRKAPALVHHDLDVVQRVLRDQLTTSFKSIWVDSEEIYENVVSFVQRFQPALVSRVKLYTRPTPIFDAFNITSELEKAIRPKVWLKSGGYIVINQTEALVAIDINTGKYVGKSNRLEDTIVKTNIDAVKEIVRQIRLRDLGGIIVVDFIDMDERKNRQKVMQALEEAMRSDRAPTKILQFNDFGLVAITRKRVKQSLERTLCAPCPYCEGAGYVKSVPTVIGEILQEAHKIARAVDSQDVVLRVNPEVAKIFKSHHNNFLSELEEILRRTVLVKSDPLLHQEKFDLA